MSQTNSLLVEQIFRDAKFLHTLGIELTAFGFGWCEAQVQITPAFHQQHGFVHAGVLMTLADHACGGAAASTLPPEKDVITVDNKISFLRPAVGDIVKCRAEVLRAGKNLIFVEAAVTILRDHNPLIVAKASSTLLVIPRKAAVPTE
jgi:uncharacterized protein (TIGR00369 family)